MSFIESCTWTISFYNNKEIPLKIPLVMDLSEEKPTFSTNPEWLVGTEVIIIIFENMYLYKYIYIVHVSFIRVVHGRFCFIIIRKFC